MPLQLTRQPSHAGRGRVGGALAAVGAVARRVGARRPRAEHHADRRRLSGLAQVSRDVLWEMDADGWITYVSSNVVGMLGAGPEAYEGRSVYTVLHPEEVPRFDAQVQRARRERTGWSEAVILVRRADGTGCWLETSGVAHVGQDGRVVGFTAVSHPAPDEPQRGAHAGVARRVEQVLEQRTVTSVFQPIVELGTGCVVGVEALARFPATPERPDEAPDRWFADAEAVGRGVELELLALQVAMSRACALPDALYCSLNLSPQTLTDPQLPGVLDEGPLPLERVVLELTEHVGVEDYARLVQVREQLRQRGVRLAVDDAGAGYASFRHILRLRPDVIKLDRDLVAGVDADPAKRAVVGAFTMFAAEVGPTVVAEGVENQAELQAVRALGIGVAQGYLLGRPTADPSEWATWDAPLAVAEPS